MRRLVAMSALFLAWSVGAVAHGKAAAAGPIPVSYFDNTGRDDVLSGGVRMIPVEDAEGDVPRLDQAGRQQPDASRSCCCTAVPASPTSTSRRSTATFPARASSTTTTISSGRTTAISPTSRSLWELPRFVEEVEQVRKALGLIRDNFYLSATPGAASSAMEYALKYQQNLKGLIVSNMMASIPATTSTPRR